MLGEPAGSLLRVLFSKHVGLYKQKKCVRSPGVQARSLVYNQRHRTQTFSNERRHREGSAVGVTGYVWQPVKCHIHVSFGPSQIRAKKT